MQAHLKVSCEVETCHASGVENWWGLQCEKGEDALWKIGMKTLRGPIWAWLKRLFIYYFFDP